MLESRAVVDVLKIDTDGTEFDIFDAIRPDLPRRVRTAFLELPRRPVLDPGPFLTAYRNETWAADQLRAHRLTPASRA